MAKKNKKINYIVKLTRVMDEGERRYSDKVNHKEYAKTSMYGKGTNRLNELHGTECPRVNELAVIIDIFVNSLAASESCMKRRTIVKIGYELLLLRDKIQEETRRRMKVYDDEGKEIKI
ncbi:uncharacterized protein METZ01_LOCUS233420 [marine metagenome]|uniref:Uncharacterized protein n=1 Tax=marine metagenome TaxID=408172 RepID=A0A382GZR8_9ZZZZ